MEKLLFGRCQMIGLVDGASSMNDNEQSNVEITVKRIRRFAKALHILCGHEEPVPGELTNEGEQQSISSVTNLHRLRLDCVA